MGRLNTIVSEACEGLEEVDGDLIQRETLKNLYDGVALKDVNTALVMTARTLVEREPNYSFVTARLLMDTLRAEGLSFLAVAESATHHEMADLYAKALPAYVAKGIEFELLNPVLAEFDLEKLGKAINHERDQQFTYLGLQTLYDRYFIHKDGIRFELPQIFFIWRSKRSSVKSAPSSSTTCCRPSTTWRRLQRCSTPVPCVHSCPAAT